MSSICGRHQSHKAPTCFSDRGKWDYPVKRAVRNAAYPIDILFLKGLPRETIVHLISGPVGAGKTSYSRKLASEHNAVVFSIDEWMQNLFGGDLPALRSILLGSRSELIGVRAKYGWWPNNFSLKARA
jgi:hypothetical protein